MQNHPKPAGMQLRSTILLVAVVGNLIFSAVFVLSTGVHVVTTGKPAGQTAQMEKKAEKEPKLVTLAQIN
jgi:hypothetical protein